MKSFPWWGLWAGLLLGAHSASAHDADILYTQVRRTPDARASQVRQVLTMTAATLGRLAPAGLDADSDGALSQAELDARPDVLSSGVWDVLPLTAGGAPCARTAQAARARATFVELTATFTCPEGRLRQRYGVLSVLPSGYRVILGSVGEGGAPGALFAEAGQPSLDIPDPGEVSSSAIGGFLGWVGLGMRHIVEGVDHLAFLLAVLLVGGGFKRVLLLVTSFTVAHSLTLGATALGWVVLDGERARWVEAAIALSIIYVAVENLVLREHRHRALVTFLFGLVHGFGFASVLAGYGLGDSVVKGLLGFNLGVELGQALVVAVLLPPLRMLQRRPRAHLGTVRVLSVGILAAGGYWMVQRALG